MIENIDFSDPSLPVVVAQVDSTTGAPTYFAIKTYGNVVSGYFSQEDIKIGAFERFKSVSLSSPNIAEIVSVIDAEGNEYYEVDYLAQDMVYREIANDNYLQDNVASIIKPYLVSRKFVVERGPTATVLQFGSGKSGETDVIAEPQAVALDIYAKDYVTDTTFDPTRLTKNENFGIVPYNTTLTVSYRINNPINSNIATNTLNTVAGAQFDFTNRASLVDSRVESVISSLEISNELPIVGDVTLPDTAEVKRRVFDTFPTQNRAVTQADYENIAYRMPAKFGSIKRVSVQKDPDSLKRNLNMYVASEDSFGKLTYTNSSIKNNLKTWLNQYRMINDTIDILDPYIINLGMEFIIKAASGADKYTLLDDAVEKLKKKYETCYYIGEHFYITDIYSALKEVSGVLDVVKVKIYNKSGANYSGASIDVDQNLSPDGTYLIIPKNCIVEIKFPETDIIGRIR